MKYYDNVPFLNGSVENQISVLNDYLRLQVNNLNFNLANSTDDKFWDRTYSALSTSIETSKSTSATIASFQSQFNATKDLIIKSASEIFSQSDEIKTMLSSSYVATSAFGTYQESIERVISESAESTTNLFVKVEAIEGDMISRANFIKYGYLDELLAGESSPFGIDIGLISAEYVEDGETIAVESPIRIRIKPDRISFIDNQYEVAYICEQAINFPKANINGGTISINSGKFSVDVDGNLYASNADISGKITASTGSIGGWTITSSLIRNIASDESGTGNIYTMLRNSTSYGNIIFAAGAAGYETSDIAAAPFYIRNSGKLYAEEAEINGSVTSKSGSNKVVIENGVVTCYYDDTNYGELTTTATTDDKYFTLLGSSSIDALTIGFNSTTKNQRYSLFYANQSYTFSASVVHVFTGDTYFANDVGIGEWSISSSTIKNVSGTYYTMMRNATESTDIAFIAGATSSGSSGLSDAPFKVRNNGSVQCYSLQTSYSIQADSIEADTLIKSPAFLIDSEIFRQVLTGNLYLGISTRPLYLYGSSIDLGIATADYISVTQSNGYGLGSYNAMRIYSSAFCVGISSMTMRLYATSVYLGESSTTVSSDERLKNNILDFNQKHENMFNMLEPKTFKYVNGTSDRTHFGFIAQQLEESLLAAGLTTQEVAAFVKLDNDDESMDYYEYGISYSELIALNTYMIKKCLSRISQLEAELINN